MCIRDREYIAQIKKEHHKANHSCSAMIVGEDGQIKRSSDDGEPSGTAGVPMLTVLEKQGLTNVVADVYKRQPHGTPSSHIERSPTIPIKVSTASVICFSPGTFSAQGHSTSELLRTL